MTEEDKIIETVDDEGNVVKFELLDIILVDEDEYGIMMPLDAEQRDENEAVIMKVDEDFVFEYIEDDAEFQKVVEAIDALEDEDFDEDEEE